MKMLVWCCRRLAFEEGSDGMLMGDEAELVSGAGVDV